MNPILQLQVGTDSDESDVPVIPQNEVAALKSQIAGLQMDIQRLQHAEALMREREARTMREIHAHHPDTGNYIAGWDRYDKALTEEGYLKFVAAQRNVGTNHHGLIELGELK